MDEDKEKKTYELALLVRNEDQIEAALTLVRRHNAEMVSEPRAKKLALAYKIKGETEGVFVSCQFRTSSEDVKNLENDLRTDNAVLRSMIIIAPPVSEKPIMTGAAFPAMRRGRPSYERSAASPAEMKPSAPRPLSNEALEKKIEEFL